MQQVLQEKSEKYLYSQRVTNGLIVDGKQKRTDIKVYRILLFLSEKHRRREKKKEERDQKYEKSFKGSKMYIREKGSCSIYATVLIDLKDFT